MATEMNDAEALWIKSIQCILNYVILKRVLNYVILNRVHLPHPYMWDVCGMFLDDDILKCGEDEQLLITPTEQKSHPSSFKS